MPRFCLFMAAVLVAVTYLIAGAPSATAGEGYAVRVVPSARLGRAPLEVTFSLTMKAERGGKIVDAFLDFGDGSSPVRVRGYAAKRHTYRKPGSFRAKLTIVTRKGERLSSRTSRFHVYPEHPADPAELLSVERGEGIAPFEANFALGGESLPFTANSAVLNFGDGTSRRVVLLSKVKHRYAKPGAYRATLLIRGKYGNRARALVRLRVRPSPRLKLTVAPRGGFAPLEVTVRAAIPSGRIREAEVTLDGKIFLARPGLKKRIFRKAGSHVFELVATMASGETVRKRIEVKVRDDDLSGYYRHDGGVVRIDATGSAFTGVMKAPSAEQAKQGYGIGTELVRGVFASAAQVTRHNTASGGTRSFYGREAAQISEGEYLILAGNCPDTWGDYRFRVDVGEAASAGATPPARISGQVAYKEKMTRADRAFRRRGLKPPRGGIIGHLQWLSYVMDFMAQHGESGNPRDCVLSDDATQTRAAAFERITDAEAAKLAEENIESVRGFARDAYDEVIAPYLDDETLRNADPDYIDSLRAADPVLLHSGELYETAIDLELAGRGLSWSFQRSYRSQSRTHGSLGHGWTHDAMFALVRDGADFLFRSSTATIIRLEPAGDGLYAGGAGLRLRVDGEHRVVRDVDGTLYRFRAAPGAPDRSWIVAVEDAAGNRIEYETDLLGRVAAAIDPLGQRALYRYDPASGYLASVETPDGRRVTFALDGAGNLVAVRHFAPGAATPYRETHYAYQGGDDPDLAHNLTRIWRPGDVGQGTATVETEYGADKETLAFDRVVRQRNGKSVESFAYARTDGADGGRFETRVAAEGRASEILRYDAGGRLRRLAYRLDDGRELVVARAYDARGRLARETLPLGNGMEIRWSADGLEKEVRILPRPASELPARSFVVRYEPLFGRIKAVFGPFEGAAPADPAAREAALVVRNDYDYEEAGSPPSGLAAFGIEADLPALGDVNGDGLTDGAAGLLLRATRPAEDAPDGTRRAPLVTRYIYGDGGLPLRVLHPDGSATVFSYQSNGEGTPAWLARVARVTAEGRERELAGYEWDDLGRLIGVTSGDGGHVGILRDARGRVAMLIPDDPSRPRRRLAHDGEGRVVGEWLLSESERRAGAKGRPFAAYEYDSTGHLVASRVWADDETAIARAYEYDAYGRLTGIVAGESAWRREFDALGRIAREGMAGEDGVGERRFSYDDNGNLIAETDPAGNRTRFTYDGLDRRIATLRADGARIEDRLDNAGRVLERRVFETPESGGAGALVSAEGTSYSRLGRAIETWIGEIDGETIRKRPRLRIVHDRLGRRQTETRLAGAAGETFDFIYDDAGLLSRITGPDGAATEIARDRAGRTRLVSRTGAGPPVPLRGFGYDDAGRVNNLFTRRGERRVWEEDAVAGRVVIHSFAPDDREIARRTIEFDRLRRPVRVIEEAPVAADPGVLRDWSFAWDDRTRLVAIDAGPRALARLAYDRRGRLATRRYFDGPEIRYAYAPTTATRTDGAGNRIVTTRDTSGRVARIAFFAKDAEAPASVSEFSHDALGRLIAHGRDGWTGTRRYDGRGLAVEDTVRDDRSGEAYVIGRAFDDAGRLIERRLPSGLAVRFAAAGTSGDGLRMSFAGHDVRLAYDAEGRLSAVDLGGATITYRREVAAGGGEIFSARVLADGAERLALRYRFDVRGILRELAISPGAELRIERDRQGRLVSGTALTPSPDGPAVATPYRFAYDERGNRTEAGFGDERTVFRPRPGYGFAAVGDAGASYDANDNLSALGSERFGRDIAGRLIAYEDAARGLAIRYRRDAFGRVVGRTGDGGELNFIRDRGRLVAEYEDGKPRREYLRDRAGNLVAVLAGGEALFAVIGPSGGVHALVDGKGNIRERYYYGPFGRVFASDGAGRALAAPTSSLLFAGMLHDRAAGLYLTPLRAYRPRLGRFLAPEPLGPLAAPHPYAYALDDPLSFHDAAGAQSMPAVPDEEISLLDRLFAPLVDAFDAAAEKVGDIFFGDDEDESGPPDDGSGGGQGGGGTPPGAAPPGASGDSPGNFPGVRADSTPRESDADRDARQLRRQGIDRRRREREAEEAAFKRNLAWAESVLPRSVVDQWLQRNRAFRTEFEDIEPESRLPVDPEPWGPTPLGAGSDPHRLLRDILRNPRVSRETAAGERIREIYAPDLGALATPLPSPRGETRRPALSTQLPDRPSAPGGAAPPRKPGGMSRAFSGF